MTDDLNLSDLGRNPAQITLKEATREEICDELERRYSSIVVLTCEDNGDDDTFMAIRFAGGFYSALGMAHSFIDTHLASQRERNP